MNKRNKSNITKTLEELGLSENEAVLYHICLKYPQSTVKELGAHSPFPRTMLYHVLNQLIRRGLVSTSTDKWRTVYISESPERLYDLLAQKEKEFDKQAHAIRGLIPQLKNKYRLSTQQPSVRIFEGIEEYKKVLEDIITSKPEVVFAYETPGKQKPGLEVRELNEARRIAKKIKKKTLFFETADALKKISRLPYNDFTEWRSTKKPSENFSVDFMLYDGKIVYTNYGKHEPKTILIEDSALYEMQKNIFLAQWKEGKGETLSYLKQK